jgi:hypothetical protein
MGWARRKDANHRLIIEMFEAHGWVICDTSRAPYCPDFFASKKGRVVAVEVKAPGKKPKPHQERFGNEWQAEYYVLTHADQVAEIDHA